MRAEITAIVLGIILQRYSSSCPKIAVLWRSRLLVPAAAVRTASMRSGSSVVTGSGSVATVTTPTSGGGGLAAFLPLPASPAMG